MLVCKYEAGAVRASTNQTVPSLNHQQHNYHTAPQCLSVHRPQGRSPAEWCERVMDCMSERWMYRRRQNLKASLFTVSTQVWGNGTFILAGEKYKLAKGFFWKKISNKIITNENLKCTWLLTCQLRFYKCIPQICVQIFKDVCSTSCKHTCKHEFKKDWINYGIKVK